MPLDVVALIALVLWMGVACLTGYIGFQAMIVGIVVACLVQAIFRLWVTRPVSPRH